MVGMDHSPDVETAQRIGRKYDILHEHTRFYKPTYSDLAIRRPDREREARPCSAEPGGFGPRAG